MRRFKIERLCTFKILYKSNNMSRENKEITVSLHLKRIKDNSEVIKRVNKILPNQILLSITPQNKRAKRLTANVKARTIQYNQWKPVHYSTTSASNYTFNTSTAGYYTIGA